MPIKKLALIASFFALGCGEKSDEERLDDIVEACESLNQAFNELAATCDGLQPSIVDCEEERIKTEENGCIDEAEASIECLEGIGYDSLECNEESLVELASCAEIGMAYNECIGEEVL
jgi:hypothetical protein